MEKHLRAHLYRCHEHHPRGGVSAAPLPSDATIAGSTQRSSMTSMRIMCTMCTMRSVVTIAATVTAAQRVALTTV